MKRERVKMYCRNCGKFLKIKANDKFCCYCGHPLAETEVKQNLEQKHVAIAKNNNKRFVKYGILLTGFAIILFVILIGLIMKINKVNPKTDLVSERDLIPMIWYEDGDGNKGKVGYKNYDNEWVIEPIYDSGTAFLGDGLALVSKDNEMYMIDQEGVEVARINLGSNASAASNTHYLGWSSFYIDSFGDDGVALLVYKDNDEEKYCFVNKEGKVTPLARYSNLDASTERMRQKGLYSAENKSSRKYGYLNGNNEIVIPFIYDHIGTLSDNGIIIARKDNETYFLNEKGDIVATVEYTLIKDFRNGDLAPVSDGKAWGYVNEKGKVVIPFQYKDAGYFTSNDVAVVQIDLGYYGIINKKGKIVAEINCDRETISVIPIEENSTFAILKDNLQLDRIVDEKGKTVAIAENKMYYGGYNIFSEEVDDDSYKLVLLVGDNFVDENLYARRMVMENARLALIFNDDAKVMCIDFDGNIIADNT